MAFQITVRPSGHVFTVEADETILEAALRHGFAFPYSCRNGVCGTCRGKLLQGEVDYRNGPPPALTPEDRARGFALFCSAAPRSDCVIEVREIGAVKDIKVRVLPCRVAKMERLANDVMRLYLKLPQVERLQYLAGQYVDILLRGGGRRGFSIANPPHDDACLELHIRHVEGGRFTGYVFNEIKEKSLLRLEGPLGTFFLREDSDRPIILMAGGTGFAPVKAMVEHAFHVAVDRPVHFFWGARSRMDLYLHKLPEQWAQSHQHFHYTPVLSEPGPEDAWTGETGWVHEAVLRAHPDLGAYDVYMSGPPPMIQAARGAFPAAGLAEDRLFYDSFEFSGDHHLQADL